MRSLSVMDRELASVVGARWPLEGWLRAGVLPRDRAALPQRLAGRKVRMGQRKRTYSSPEP